MAYPRESRQEILSGAVTYVLACGTALGGWSMAVWAGEPSADAARLYRQQRYDEAAERLERAVTNRPNEPALRYNLGTARYRQGQFEPAIEAFNHSRSASQGELQRWASYNAGNAYYRQAQSKAVSAPQEAAGLYQRALDAYRLALRQDPEEHDARYNYELTQRRLQQLRAEPQQAQTQQAESGASGSSPPQPSSSRPEQEADGWAMPQAAAGSPGASAPSAGGLRQEASESAEQPGDQGPLGASELGGDDGTAAGDARQAAQLRPGEGEPSQATAQRRVSQQEALWILDTLRQEERRALPSPQRPGAREPVLQQDW